MSLALCDLEITNFRSIRGQLYAPLDAKVVLIHGENGAGKTSFLSAIELALTGRVAALRRADPNYTAQLLHKTMAKGSVEVRARDEAGETKFASTLDARGLTVGRTLAAAQAGFFSERCYLPQSLLGQLLQIYQDSDSGLDSPLARFVGNLLGLDRLDILEAGLKNLGDVRNVRKLASGWGDIEVEKNRLDRTLADKHKALESLLSDITAARVAILETASQLALPHDAGTKDLTALEIEIRSTADEGALERLVDRRRQLESIRREAERFFGQEVVTDPDVLANTMAQAKIEIDAWRLLHDLRIDALRSRMERLLPGTALPSELNLLHDEALKVLQLARTEATDRSTRSSLDAERLVSARNELTVAETQLATIDLEIGRIGANTSGLGAALAELTSFISSDVCPVCDRDFSDVVEGPLIDHVHAKVRTLSGSAERLLTLSRSRGEAQLSVEALDREINTLMGRQLEPQELADAARRTAAFDGIIGELANLRAPLIEGARLEAAEVDARKRFSAYQARDLDARATLQTLRDYATTSGQDEPMDGETASAAAHRLTSGLAEKIHALETRLTLRRRAGETFSSLAGMMERQDIMMASIVEDEDARTRTDAAIARGNALRATGQTIRAQVDAVRSSVIRKEFNDRLNRLWRDLFVRLAPGEPFVPAFSIPEGNTQRLQPKLITLNRDGGDAGGTPGAMLSAGNLNTATLTLFMAMHMSVPAQLPWLILDDPVQSMDDVHIAHFAALLRTLSKQHGRQVMLAVHDRQLFEYLKLELSPAYPEDSLLTLELSRSTRRDTVCISNRLSFQEETALRAAA